MEMPDNDADKFRPPNAPENPSSSKARSPKAWKVIAAGFDESLDSVAVRAADRRVGPL
jgi:hypothetical protein